MKRIQGPWRLKLPRLKKCWNWSHLNIHLLMLHLSRRLSKDAVPEMMKLCMRKEQQLLEIAIFLAKPKQCFLFYHCYKNLLNYSLLLRKWVAVLQRKCSHKDLRYQLQASGPSDHLAIIFLLQCADWHWSTVLEVSS